MFFIFKRLRGRVGGMRMRNFNIRYTAILIDWSGTDIWKRMEEIRLSRQILQQIKGGHTKIPLRRAGWQLDGTKKSQVNGKGVLSKKISLLS